MTDRPQPLPLEPTPVDHPPENVSRRGLLVFLTNLLGAAVALVVAIPGVKYLLDPLGRKEAAGEFRALPITLDELTPGVPRQFPIVETRTDAWVKYPPEPVGSVWLVRNAPGADQPLIAFTSECPHLGCAINLTGDSQSFFCPCHASAFLLDGERINAIPPRPMDRLEIDPASIAATNTPIRVKFQRFRTGSEEKLPLA